MRVFPETQGLSSVKRGPGCNPGPSRFSDTAPNRGPPTGELVNQAERFLSIVPRAVVPFAIVPLAVAPPAPRDGTAGYLAAIVAIFNTVEVDVERNEHRNENPDPEFLAPA